MIIHFNLAESQCKMMAGWLSKKQIYIKDRIRKHYVIGIAT